MGILRDLARTADRTNDTNAVQLCTKETATKRLAYLLQPDFPASTAAPLRTFCSPSIFSWQPGGSPPPSRVKIGRTEALIRCVDYVFSNSFNAVHRWRSPPRFMFFFFDLGPAIRKIECCPTSMDVPELMGVAAETSCGGICRSQDRWLGPQSNVKPN